MLKKKSIEGATVLIKKVKTNMIEVRKLRGDLEKILADVVVDSDAFAELKLKEWNQYEIDLNDHLLEIKDEVT